MFLRERKKKCPKDEKKINQAEKYLDGEEFYDRLRNCFEAPKCSDPVFCIKMIFLKFHISSVNQKNDFNAFSASVVEQRLYRKNGRCNFFTTGRCWFCPCLVGTDE